LCTLNILVSIEINIHDFSNRRSPSIASEISTLLEPIPEESDYSYPYLGGGEGSLAYEKRIETLRKEKDAARQEFFKDLMPKNNQGLN